MKVRIRLYLSSAVTISLIGILVLIVFLTSNQVTKESKRHKLAYETQLTVSQLDILGYEYLLHHEKRMKEQWSLIYNSLTPVLAEAAAAAAAAEEEEEEEEERRLTVLLNVNYTKLGDLFLQIIANYDEREKLIQKEAPQEKINANIQLEERLVAQFLIISQLIITDTSQLAEKAYVRLIEIQELARNLTLLTVLVLFITSTVTAATIIRSVSRSLIKLYEGAEIIGKGNLEHRIDIRSKDEIGLLSEAFNKMADEILAAQSNLESKVENRTKELNKKKNSLEKQQQAMLNILEDIEEEKNNVSKEKDKIDTILYSIGDGVFVIDKDFKIIVFNQAAENISGFSEKEVIGKKYGDVLKFVFENSGKVNDGFVKKAMNTGEVKELSNHTVLIRKDGKKIAVADSAAPLRNKEGKVVGCVVVFRDVSRERRISQMESEFVSIASHQLRTPITAIQWLMELILKKEKISKKGREYLNDVHASAIRLNALVDLLLNVSKVEAGKISVSFREIEVIETIERYLKESKGLFVKKNIILTFKEHPKALNVITDNNLFRNILQSLVSNAIDYTLEKGKIEVSLEKKPKSFVLVVSDTGIGIPEKEQATIFDKFTRASNAKLVKTDGTGLGLYFTKQIVGLLGGKIWLKSAKDKGATFYVELPLNSKTKVKNTNSN